MCGGFNANLIRTALQRWRQLGEEVANRRLEIAGKRGIKGFKFRGVPSDIGYTHFEDRPSFDEVDVIASRYLEEYETGKLDRLDVVYMKFETVSRQRVAVETLLPLGSLGAEQGAGQSEAGAAKSQYEFLPSPESILEEVVPTSFKVRLFKCFLDSAVSEQIARMVAMKSATENADELIKHLTMQYNRARQGRITSELMDVIGGAEAIS
jgi:F-type H+-transporting ATPase subunit gamma